MHKVRRVLTILAILGIILMGLAWPVIRAIRQRRLDRQLVAAVRSGDVVSAAALLDHGADPNARDVPASTGVRLQDIWKTLLRRRLTGDESRYSPALLLAVELSDLRMARCLLEHGASPNVRDHAGATVLMDAIVDGSPDIADLLIEHGANIEALDRFRDTPLMWASYWAEDSVVKHLLAHHANVNARNAANWTPLMFAAGSDPDVVISGRNIHQLSPAIIGMAGSPPTPRASDLAQTIRLLIAAGADINAKDAAGNTVLIRAYCLGNQQAALLLIEAGADVNQPIMTTYIENPVFFTERGYYAVYSDAPRRPNGQPIQVGADLNRNATLLMLAALCEDRGMVRTLLAHGASLTRTDSRGKTALSYARGHPTILALLRQAPMPQQE